MNLHRNLTLLVLALTLAGCTWPGPSTPAADSAPTAIASPLGTQGNPIVLAIRPGSTPEATEAVGRIAAQLSTFTGLTVVTGQVGSTNELVESLGAGTVHIAVMSPFAYLLAHEKGYADAALAGIVDGKQKLGAQFLVNAQLAGVSGYKIYFDPDANINVVEAATALAQFVNKKPCWTDAYSPVGYVFPLGLLNQQGIAVKTGAFLQGDAAVVKTLYQDTRGALCEFGVTVIDGRADVAAEFPDVNEKVLVVWRSEELIPLDGIAFSASLPDDARFRIAAAFLALVGTSQGASDMKAAYGLDGLQLADDTFYTDLRAYVGLSNLDLITLIR